MRLLTVLKSSVNKFVVGVRRPLTLRSYSLAARLQGEDGMRLEGIKVCWDAAKWSPKDIHEQADRLIESTREAYDKVASVPEDQVNFETVIRALQDIHCEMYTLGSPLNIPQHVSTDKAVRDASSEAERKMEDFEVEMSMRVDIFKKVVAFQEKCGTDGLKPEAKRVVERLVKLGMRNGLHLAEETRQKVKDIKKKLSDLSITFQRNLNEVDTELLFSDDQLAGLPQEFIDALDKAEDGKRRVTLKYPHFFPVTRKCKVASTRKALETAYQSRCIKENTAILEELIQLRQKQADLLGYPNHAAYIQEMRMAKNPATVDKFLQELATKLKPLWEKERKVMMAFKKEEALESSEDLGDDLCFWDLRYYMCMVEEKLYAVDKNKMREYFPLETVTKGLLEIYQELLGLKFTEQKEGDKWHEDVRIFKVEDASSGAFLGYFFLDLHPRDGKYGHACVFKLQPGCLSPDGKGKQVPVAGMVTNFTRPTASRPALLDHDEVETYFHEFGHVMHNMCSEADYAMFSGTRVERDFVEAPSQMLENWVWEEEPLRRMSGHFKDGSPIPAETLQKLIQSKKANAGAFNLRQVLLATFDQMIHRSGGPIDTQKAFSDLYRDLVGVETIPDTNMPANFGHLAGGYDAQYYGYLWSEVFSMDMFAARFKSEGIMNPKVGMDYRKCILAPGGSVDAVDMLKSFLGREPNQEAFLRSKGLAAEDGDAQ